MIEFHFLLVSRFHSPFPFLFVIFHHLAIFFPAFSILLNSKIGIERIIMQISTKIPHYFVIFFVAIVLVSAQSDECEVCIDVFTEVMAKVEASGQKGEGAVREHIVKHCKTVKGVDEKKEKLCFFIGAHPDSATSVLGDIAKPLSFHKPPKKVCSELKEKDSQICALKYDKPIDWDSLVLEKMRVKQLKELLQKLGDSCKGCTEKVDYITRINELKPKAKGEL